jgi:hypothetical protein
MADVPALAKLAAVDVLRAFLPTLPMTQAHHGFGLIFGIASLREAHADGCAHRSPPEKWSMQSPARHFKL